MLLAAAAGAVSVVCPSCRQRRPDADEGEKCIGRGRQALLSNLRCTALETGEAREARARVIVSATDGRSSNEENAGRIVRLEDHPHAEEIRKRE